MTQHEQILKRLRNATGTMDGDITDSDGNIWVDGVWFLSQYMPTYSQRIGELIEDGHAILRCQRSDIRPLEKNEANVGCYRMEQVQLKWGI